MTDWSKLDYRITPDMEKYVNMLCEAGDVDSEVKLLVRYGKVVKLIHDDLKEKYDTKDNKDS